MELDATSLIDVDRLQAEVTAMYLDALDAHSLRVMEVRRNDYRFTSERAVGACRTYAVQSISVLAAKP